MRVPLLVLLGLALLAASASARFVEKADLVVVQKSESMLYLMREGAAFAAFPVAFGRNPEGHKQQEGDGRTPEGRYTLDFKNEDSAFHKAIRISYPNEEDMARAAARGVEPGGLIMIHGQRNGFDWLSLEFQYSNWTEGCIALRNEYMDYVWDAIDEGTLIEIFP